MCVWKERFDGRSLEVFLLRGLRLDRVVGTVRWLGFLQSLFTWLFTVFQCELGIKLSLGTLANIAFLFAFLLRHFLNEKAIKVQILPCCFQYSSASTYGEFLLVEAILKFFSTALVAGTPEVATCLAQLSQRWISFWEQSYCNCREQLGVTADPSHGPGRCFPPAPL